MFEDKEIILASLSPRRKQLLELAEVKFTQETTGVNETYPGDMAPDKVAEYLAEKKARAVQPQVASGKLILAADTIVVIENKILGKPKDKNNALEMLASLSGKKHEVITGVCLLRDKLKRSFSETTCVYFRTLQDGDIRHYVEKYLPMDKAGAYAIQEWIGLVGIEKIEGDYFNVVGLPVGRVIEEIGKFSV